MKIWILLFIAFSFKPTLASAQKDTLLNKEFIFNKFSIFMLNKLGTVSDVTYDIGEKWRVIGYHKHYRWEDETKNFLLVSENNDSGWIDRIAFLESLNEKKTIYYALDFIPLVLKYTPEQFAKIMNAVPWIGMKEEDLILSYGNPDDTHTTISGNTISKQYVYGKTASLYFYFTNGKLTTIQD